MTRTPDLEHAKANTQQVYEEYAAQWDSERPRLLYESKWLDRFASAISAGGTIFDLGCGAGEPVSQYLIERDFNLTGIDFAGAMIDLAKKRFPKHQWLVHDMRDIQTETRFDGLISWDGFFHLSQSEQRGFFEKLPALLKEKSALLFTIGTGDGEVTGTVAGQSVYHASLSPEEYRDILQNLGFGTIEIVIEDETALGRSILFATR